jgi:Cys-Gly metallodipeptidase DUG1
VNLSDQVLPFVTLSQVASALEKMIGAPALMLPMGQSSDNCHLANERMRRINLIKGKNVVKRICATIPELG